MTYYTDVHIDTGNYHHGPVGDLYTLLVSYDKCVPCLILTKQNNQHLVSVDGVHFHVFETPSLNNDTGCTNGKCQSNLHLSGGLILTFAVSYYLPSPRVDEMISTYLLKFGYFDFLFEMQKWRILRKQAVFILNTFHCWTCCYAIFYMDWFPRCVCLYG